MNTMDRDVLDVVTFSIQTLIMANCCWSKKLPQCSSTVFPACRTLTLTFKPFFNERCTTHC